MRRLLIFLGLVSAISCASMMIDEMNKGLLEFKPPKQYYILYTEVLECSGRFRNFDSLRFFVAPTVYIVVDTTLLLAYYNPESKTIYFGLGWENVPWVVRHEFRHHLDPTIKNHDSTYFGRNSSCGHLINP